MESLFRWQKKETLPSNAERARTQYGVVLQMVARISHSPVMFKSQTKQTRKCPKHKFFSVGLPFSYFFHCCCPPLLFRSGLILRLVFRDGLPVQTSSNRSSRGHVSLCWRILSPAWPARNPHSWAYKVLLFQGALSSPGASPQPFPPRHQLHSNRWCLPTRAGSHHNQF